MAKHRTVDQVRKVSSGVLEIRFVVVSDDGSKTYHRTTIAPDMDAAAHLRELGKAFSSQGEPAISSSDSSGILRAVKAAHTAGVVRAYRASQLARKEV